MYLCLCRAVTLARVREVLDTGACTVKAVGEACGAGTDCGGCRGEIRHLIREQIRRERRDDEAA